MIEAKATSSTKAVNRREFLYCLLGTSAAALAAGTCGAASWAIIPFRPFGPRGGLFVFTLSQLPPLESPPRFFKNDPVLPGRSANFFLSNTDQGLLALQQACTARGCLYKWNPNGKIPHPFPSFICPCCGSQFSAAGVYVEGPAPRNLDQFAIEVTTPTSIRRTPEDGGPVDVHDATQIVVDVERPILGKPRPMPTATPSR